MIIKKFRYTGSESIIQNKHKRLQIRLWICEKTNCLFTLSKVLLGKTR